jgi:lysine 6-dehydrogenase
MKIAVLGAGAAGTAITQYLIKEPGVTAISVIDRNGNNLDELEDRVNSSKLRFHRVSMEKENAIFALIKGYDCIISALPYNQNYKMASLAVKAGVSYVDLGGDDATLARQFTLDEKAREQGVFVVPNAGFAPGLVNILAMHGYESFKTVESIVIRAAVLPANPIPPLKLHLSFSPLGLINEYLNKVSVLENGEYKEMDALDGYETMSLKSMPDLGPLEAFYTSGSSTILAKSLVGKVKTFDFKTIRYKGHRDIIKSFFDLGFNSTHIIDIQTSLTYKDLLIRQLKRHMPHSDHDIAVAKVIIKGTRDNKNFVREYELNLVSDQSNPVSAMMTCTALSSVTVALLLAEGKVNGSGGVSAPELLIPLEEFLQRMTDHGLNISIQDFEA